MKHPPCGAFGAPLSPDPSPARGEGRCYPLSPGGRGAGGEGDATGAAGRPLHGGRWPGLRQLHGLRVARSAVGQKSILAANVPLSRGREQGDYTERLRASGGFLAK